MEYKYIKPFSPTEEKFADLAKRLMETKWYLPDGLRTEEKIGQLLLSHFANGYSWHEIGDWGGLFGLVNQDDSDNADLFFKIWDKSLWNHKVAREVAGKVNELLDEYELMKITLFTPDEHMCKFAERHGFEREGRLKNHFRWNGKYYDTICLALNRR